MPLRRNYRKKPYIKRKTAIKKKSSKRLVKTIQNVINRDQELKYVSYYERNQTPLYYNSTSSVMTTFQLLPTIVQGTGYSNRVVNQIQVTNAIVKYRLFMPQGAAATEPIYVRVFVGHLRPYPALNPTLSANGYSDLFRVGNSTSPPQNNDLDQIMRTNIENWVIIYDKVHKIGQSSVVSGDPQAANNDFILSYTGRINLTRHLGKLMYNDQATNLPTNKNWFMWLCPARVGGQSATSGATVPLGLTYDSQIFFKDA